MTFFYKRIFPAFWFGFLNSVHRHSASFLPERETAPRRFHFLIVPLIMMGFGYFVMKKLVFDLVDEVWDDGEALLIKNRGQEERIALCDIKNVSYSPVINPPRVTLRRRPTTGFGDQIAFVAPARFMPFAASSIIDDLIERVDQARQRRV